MENTMNSKEILTIFMSYFITYAKESTHEENKVKELNKNLVTLSDLKEICKGYSDISEFVYKLSDSDFQFLKIFFDLDKEEGYYTGFFESSKLSGTLTSDQIDNLEHFERHVKLSCHQRDYIVNNFMRVSKGVSHVDTELKDFKGEIEDIENDIRKVINNVDKASKGIENIETKVKKAENKVNGIYSEFVGILGVFTALSFALMGSVQVFGNILKNIDTPTVGNIGYVLVVGGIYLLLIYLVIMTLFIGMKKVFKEGSEYQFNRAFTWRIIGTSAGLVLLGFILVVIH
ncbi:hypothetical protein [Ligilactobacillus salivarius]|nr:hypothetical protein [Ligilactobacillus salivarius]MDW3022954.1 hypothetical protein [Ligilactobacillus salivarius]